jgi:hypothetical protein
MSWATENKFLIGFGAAMLAGVGALGYLTFSAMGGYEAATADFSNAKDDLARVEGLRPFPSEATLKEIVTEKQALKDKLSAVQQDFKDRVLPIEPVRKEAFQDRLKDTVAAVIAGAADAQVGLPDKFYLDYTDYRDKPPEELAAPLLARQLRSIKLIMDLLIQEGHLELKELAREPFSEEKTKPKTAEPKPAPAKPGSAPAPKADRKLVEKTGFTIKFVCGDDALRRILNGIVGNKHQIFIIRRVAVQNEKPTSPQKTATTVAPAAPVAPTAPSAPVKPATPGSPASTATAAPVPPQPAVPMVNLEYAFGKERVEATIDIEVLDFAEPDKQTAKGGKPKGK